MKLYRATGIFLTLCTFFYIENVTAKGCTRDDMLFSLPEKEVSRIELMQADVVYSVGLLWEAKKEKRTIYILGTNHFVNAIKVSNEIVDKIHNSIEKSKSIFVESSKSNFARLDHYYSSNSNTIVLGEEGVLTDFISNDILSRVNIAAKLKGVSFDLLNNLRPWYAAILLSSPPCVYRNEDHESLDSAVESYARGLGKTIRSLDSYSVVSDTFGKLKLDDQVSFLSLVVSAPLYEDHIHSLTEKYFLQEKSFYSLEYANAMYGLVSRELDKGEKGIIEYIERVVVKERNRKWAEIIDQYNNIFVAVGSSHIYGKKGLLDLLNERGWQIKRL